MIEIPHGQDPLIEMMRAAAPALLSTAAGFMNTIPRLLHVPSPEHLRAFLGFHFLYLLPLFIAFSCTAAYPASSINARTLNLYARV